MEDSFDIKIPNFTLGKEIGRGGMARVFLGEQLEPKRKVAIKIVTPQGNDPKILADLQKEGDTVAQFSHPNIVTVFSCGVIDQNYYLAMEILGGGDLAQKIKSGVTELEAFNIMLDMARALEHAHKRGTLHRDIKPENILFHEDGQAVLLDFGIAKAQNSVSEFTRMGAVVGTPDYMSPERTLGQEIDARSDIYALGVVLYEMLMGQKVFKGSDTYSISYAHVHEPIPDLPQEKSSYQSLLNKLLAKDPDDRFQNTTQLISQLKKHLRRLKPRNDTTHSFAPLTDIAAMKKRFRPMPFIITGVAVVVLVLIGIWFMRQQATIDVNQTTLTREQQVEMSNKLSAANSQFNLGDFNMAEQLYEAVLVEFDCTDEEARTRMKTLNKTKFNQIVASCEE